VFVNPASIVATTGAIISRDARVTQLFNQVTDYKTTCVAERAGATRLDARALQLGVPVERHVRLAAVVDMTRGFGGGNTAGDPYLTTWGAPAATPAIRSTSRRTTR
jgi:hypothetical protein